MVSAGRKVSAPTSRMVPITKTANNEPVIGNVPALVATTFFRAREPASAITGINIPNRPINVANARVIL
jgi:hypothetical protein